MDFRIKGKRALVMGASSGLGEAIARALVAEGARVAICSSNDQRIKRAATSMGAELALAVDLNKPGAGAKVVKQVEAEWGGVDILVTNNGGPPKGPFESLTTQQWQEGFQSLWISAVESIQAALPKMKENRWGRILLVTSAAAKEPMSGLNISNGLRAGLLGLTKSISNEVAEYGVTINALLPGYTATERLKELGIPEEKITSHIPARRLGQPEEFAALAAFLSSEQAAYICGQAIACDGGYLRGI